MKNLKTFEQMFESLSSMGWKEKFKVGDKVRLTHNFNTKEDAVGTIEKLTNDDIWLDNGSHYGSLSWGAELETGEHVDEFLGLDKVKDKLSGVKKFTLDTFKPSGDAKDFIRRGISSYKEKLKKLNIPEDLFKNAVMALYDFAEGVPLLDRLHLEYDEKSKTLTVDPNKKKKGLFGGDPVMG